MIFLLLKNFIEETKPGQKPSTKPRPTWILLEAYPHFGREGKQGTEKLYFFLTNT